MQIKKSNFTHAILLGCFILLSAVACNSSETKPADEPKATETVAPPPAPAAKDSPTKIIDTASTRPLKPGS